MKTHSLHEACYLHFEYIARFLVASVAAEAAATTPWEQVYANTLHSDAP